MDQVETSQSDDRGFDTRRPAGAARVVTAANFLRIGSLAIAASILFGCGGGPTLVFPGGTLAGSEVSEPVPDWSFVTDRFVDLETNPEDPYSVELNYILRGGELYLDPSEGKDWLAYIREDARVRVRFGDKIYRATAVLVGNPGELPDFDPERFIYRLDPR